MKHVVQSSGPLKFVSSSSASTGQNAILGKGTATASLVHKKFGKAKEERNMYLTRSSTAGKKDDDASGPTTDEKSGRARGKKG